MQKDIDKLNEIKFGLLDEYTLRWLEKKIATEQEKRKKPETPEEHFEVVIFDDGCEGHNLFIEKFDKIDPKEFVNYIIQTLNVDSSVTISKSIIEKKDYYDSNMHYYNWFEEDQKNPNEKDEDDE